MLVILSRQPWATAGQLSPAAMDEVASILARYTESNEGVDLARFVHLSSDGNEYLIYATPLTDGLVLALIYEINTPLTVIRSQAGRLSRQLRAPAEPAPPAEAPPRNLAEEAELPVEMDEEDPALSTEAQRLADLLSEMPSPNPPVGPEMINSDWVQAAPVPAPETDEFLFPWEVEAAHNAAAQTQGIPTGPPQTPAKPAEAEQRQAQTTATVVRNAREARPTDATRAIPSSRPANPAGPATASQQQAASLEQTRPVMLHSQPSIQPAEPLMPAFSRLAYTIVLIPRLPGHLLIDQPAEQLSGWLPQLCLAYGWRLEGLLIRPEYLQWTVQVEPAISPGNVIRLIRQQSSRRIFSQFPQFEIDNPSGDFWAPGYLIISGYQPPPFNLVHDFIRQTRQRQGSLPAYPGASANPAGGNWSCLSFNLLFFRKHGLCRQSFI